MQIELAILLEEVKEWSTHKSCGNDPLSSALVQAEVLSLSSSLVDRVFCNFDLFEVLLNSGEFSKDWVFASFDSMKTKICWSLY